MLTEKRAGEMLTRRRAEHPPFIRIFTFVSDFRCFLTLNCWPAVSVMINNSSFPIRFLALGLSLLAPDFAL
jgi:hypothetical protein